LELKPKVTPHASASFPSINRTILELKLLAPVMHRVKVYTINRTILELKLLWSAIRIININLLIEPFWN